MTANSYGTVFNYGDDGFFAAVYDYKPNVNLHSPFLLVSRNNLNAATSSLISQSYTAASNRLYIEVNKPVALNTEKLLTRPP